MKNSKKALHFMAPWEWIPRERINTTALERLGQLNIGKSTTTYAGLQTSL
jgi:hypothetical protein